MKRIILVRHAKSSWSDLSLMDIDRPLKKRGLRDAPFMAEKVKEYVPSVDLILVSPARRAQLTSDYFRAHYPNAEVKTEDAIYEAYVGRLEQLINELDQNVEVIMMFGHNPAFTILANKYASTPFANLPTCGIAVIDFNGNDWKDFDTSTADMKLLLYPKQFNR